MASVKQSSLEFENGIRKRIIALLDEAMTVAEALTSKEINYFLCMTRIAVLEEQDRAISAAEPAEVGHVIRKKSSNRIKQRQLLAAFKKCPNAYRKH